MIKSEVHHEKAFSQGVEPKMCIYVLVSNILGGLKKKRGVLP